MHLLLVALAGGTSLVAALQVARSTRPGSPEAGRLIALAIVLLLIGLLAAMIGGDWLGYELDASLLATFGVFFLLMGLGEAVSAARTPGARGSMWARLGHLALAGLGLVLVVAATRRHHGITAAQHECQERYTAARDASDTVAVDRVVPRGSPRPISRYSSVMTCGEYRARGFAR
jgi:hypothetical protein